MRRHLSLLRIPTLAALLIACVCSIATGCRDYSTPDSHREVFKTPEQAAMNRRGERQTAWEDLASTMVHADRPDLQAKRATGTFGIVVSADGVDRTIDLGPIEEELSHHSERERELLRNRLADELRRFDAARVRAIGFNGTRPQIFPQLLNDKQLAELQKAFPASPIHATPVVINLSWVPVVRREGGELLLPVGEDLLFAWKATPASVDTAAVENLRARLKRYAPPVETLSFGALGRSASLKPGVGAEVILLPEFLEQVRAEWKSGDDLVLFVPSRNGGLLAERNNEKLLDKLIPEWKKIAADATDPLCDQLLLRTPEKLSIFAYTPAAKPAGPVTKPATPKPEIYIVR